LQIITYANKIFVAGGDYGTKITSSDGITWEIRVSQTTNNLTKIIYANKIFVIVGSSGTILTSSDGIT
jgi:hypothetical protein